MVILSLYFNEIFKIMSSYFQHNIMNIVVNVWLSPLKITSKNCLDFSWTLVTFSGFFIVWKPLYIFGLCQCVIEWSPFYEYLCMVSDDVWINRMSTVLLQFWTLDSNFNIWTLSINVIALVCICLILLALLLSKGRVNEFCCW